MQNKEDARHLVGSSFSDIPCCVRVVRMCRFMILWEEAPWRSLARYL